MSGFRKRVSHLDQVEAIFGSGLRTSTEWEYADVDVRKFCCGEETVELLLHLRRTAYWAAKCRLIQNH